jgi:hypothetical protein
LKSDDRGVLRDLADPADRIGCAAVEEVDVDEYGRRIVGSDIFTVDVLARRDHVEAGVGEQSRKVWHEQ